MASPAAAGAALLVREYFMVSSSVFWSGQCNSAYHTCHSFTPSGVLVKAILLHSGTRMVSYLRRTYCYIHIITVPFCRQCTLLRFRWAHHLIRHRATGESLSKMCCRCEMFTSSISSWMISCPSPPSRVSTTPSSWVPMEYPCLLSKESPIT